jgi:beta-propeller uncharacterized protein DUF5122
MSASAFTRRILGVAALAASGLMVGAVAPADASTYPQPTVVSDNAADWTPNLVVTPGAAKPVAYSIAQAGAEMVVGGRFAAVENATRTTQFVRSNVFAFDASNGTIDSRFAPVVNGDVWSVLSDGSSVYIGGAFTTVDGVPRTALAKLDLATGQLDPTFNANFKGGRVSDMQFSHGQLIVAGTISRRLMSVNPATGAATSYIQNVVGGKLPNSNSAQVFKFDVSPDGQHLVAVGNFTTVDSQDRPRVFMLDLGATGSTLSSWSYAPLGLSCTSTRRIAIDYVQDVDFAPDSSYFALASFGYMFQSGQRWYQLCDSVSRFETNNLAPTQPTWIDYTGGDSLKSVAVTGAAIYVQGHSRWLDNPYGQDYANDGAVARLGGGAVDPNGGGYARSGDVAAKPGKALAWNPVMPQQSGGFQILPTQAGVWFATDGARFGGEYHRGIRFAPLVP